MAEARTGLRPGKLLGHGLWPVGLREKAAMSIVRKQSDADQQEPAKSVPIRGADEKRGIGRWWSDARTFLSEVRTEMRRVTWPSRREVYATTLVVILTAMFFGLYLWGLDLAIDRMVRWIFRVSGVA